MNTNIYLPILCPLVNGIEEKIKNGTFLSAVNTSLSSLNRMPLVDFKIRTSRLPIG